jgi:hypothetical protein
MISQSFFVYIDSRNRVGEGTDASFQYNIKIPSGSKFDRVVVLNALIPKSNYLVVDNSTFIVQENSINRTIIVPPGDYLLNTFKTVIQQLLNTGAPMGWTYTVSFPNINTSANTGKYTYSVSGNSGSQPSFIFNSLLWEQFGFDENSTNNFIANSLTSENVIKLQVHDRLFICSNIMQSGSVDDHSILQEINASSSTDFSTIIYQCFSPEAYSKKLASSENSSVFFKLLDEHFNVIDLNGLNWHMTLLIYKVDDVYKRIKDFIKLLVLPNDNEST